MRLLRQIEDEGKGQPAGVDEAPPAP